MSNRTRISIFAAIATQLLYGLSFVFTKNVVGRVDVFTLLGWRFTVALVTMLILIAVRVVRIRITRATLRPLLLLAIFQPVIYYVGENYGVMRTTASESGLIMSAIPVALLLTSAVILRRRPTGWQVAGIAITLAGVAATVVAGGLTASFDGLGYVLLLVAVIAYALYAAFADRFATAASDVDKTFVMVAGGALFFGTMTLARHGADGTLGQLAALPFTDLGFAVAVAYLSLGSTIGAFFMQNLAIGHLGSTRYSTFIGLTTATTLAAGAIFLGERLGPAQLIGGALILAGVYVANVRRSVRPAADGSAVSPGQ